MRVLALVPLLAFVPPKRDTHVEIAGEYDAVGTHPDGSKYQGRGSIVRLGGERYEITFTMPNGVFRGICLRVRDVLGCGWGSGDDLTVAIWRDGGGVDGVWTHDGAAAVGRESSTGSLAAPFTARGVSPSGVGYDASVTVTPYGAVQRVLWVRGAETTTGWGVRSGPFLIAGFPAHRAGAAFYRIGPGGTVLVGEWMDPNTPMAGLGSETLTR